jgi:eukaryotic-like serine/threonine-protein kinase
MKSHKTSFPRRLFQRGQRGIVITGILLVLLVAGLTIGAFAIAHPSKSASASTVLNVYISTGDGTLYKLAGDSGAVSWHVQETDRNLPAPPAIANGVVYLSTLTGSVYALDAATGQTKWSVKLDGNIVSSPIVVNNVVYAGSDSNYIYALNASNGSVIWRFDAGVGNETVVTRSVAVANGIVYGSASDLVDHSYLFAINASNGQQIWRVKVHDQLFTDVQDVNGVLYFASSAIVQQGGPRTTDSYVYAYDAKTGNRLWISQAIANMILSAPAISNGVVYVGSANTFVYALNASTGAQLWSSQFGGPIYASPVVANGDVFVGIASNPSTAAPTRTSDATTTSGSIVALNATTGTLIWQQQINNYTGTPLAYANNLIYFGTNDNQAYALNASTGLQTWSYQMSSAIPLDNAPVSVGP